MKVLYVVAGALINEKNEVLLTSRPEGKEFAGFWEFPGGKIEDGEIPETALKRELNEELGITLNESDLIEIGFVSHPYARFHLVMLFFACRKWQGTPIPLENQKAAFVSMDGFNVSDSEFSPNHEQKFSLPPADKKLAVQLKEFLSR